MACAVREEPNALSKLREVEGARVRLESVLVFVHEVGNCDEHARLKRDHGFGHLRPILLHEVDERRVLHQHRDSRRRVAGRGRGFLLVAGGDDRPRQVVMGLADFLERGDAGRGLPGPPREWRQEVRQILKLKLTNPDDLERFRGDVAHGLRTPVFGGHPAPTIGDPR